MVADWSAAILGRKAPTGAQSLFALRAHAGKDARAPSTPRCSAGALQIAVAYLLELCRPLFDERRVRFFEIRRLHAQGLRDRFGFQG